MLRFSVCVLFILLTWQFLSLPDTTYAIGSQSANFLVMLNAALFIYYFLGFIRPSANSMSALRLSASGSEKHDPAPLGTAQRKPSPAEEPA